MTTPSAEALRRFKRVDLEEILEDAQQRLSQTPEETLQQWRDNIFRETKGYSDLAVLKRSLDSSVSLVSDFLKTQKEYLASHQDSDFTEQEIQNDNEYVDRQSLYIAFLIDEIEKFPPMPVLPPPEPLIKVCGVVEEVELIKARTWFDAQAYMTTDDLQAFKAQLDNKGMVGAMLTNSFSGSVVSSSGSSDKVNCLYTKGKINGKTFSGWFGMTDIRPGDRVEMAVAPYGDSYLVYAIASPERRTVSFVPGCDIGTKTVNMKQGIVIWLVLGLLAYIPGIWGNTHGWLTATLFYFAVCILMAYITLYQIRRKNKCIMILFDEICDVLMPEHKNKGLRSFSKRKARQLKERGQQNVTNGVPLPAPNQSSNYIEEYFFYY
ncbi:hypothetical protein [Franconibacter daqui]|uniref:Uncharacterized protein n=1 Tax=Franconibacter daqui TaxID=2047724 RepID=A0ABV1PH80_9ENTR